MTIPAIDFDSFLSSLEMVVGCGGRGAVLRLHSLVRGILHSQHWALQDGHKKWAAGKGEHKTGHHYLTHRHLPTSNDVFFFLFLVNLLHFTNKAYNPKYFFFLLDLRRKSAFIFKKQKFSNFQCVCSWVTHCSIPVQQTDYKLVPGLSGVDSGWLKHANSQLLPVIDRRGLRFEPNTFQEVARSFEYQTTTECKHNTIHPSILLASDPRPESYQLFYSAIYF